MNFNEVSEFFTSIFNHNFKIQKELENSNILLLRDLQKYIEDFPLADIYVHYPNDVKSDSISYCISISDNSPLKLMPVHSIIAHQDKIILSCISQSELNTIDFTQPLNFHEHYLSSSELMKRFFSKEYILSPQEHDMIFIENISDSLGWKSQHSSEKVYQAFNFCSVQDFMLWHAYYFTPHY